MQLLLCAATGFEIRPTIEFINKYNIVDCTVLITGVGLPSTTYHLTRRVLGHRPDLLLQAGVAGSLDPGLELASVVAVRSETFGDIGVMENKQFVSVFDLGLVGRDADPWRQGRLTNHSELLQATGLDIVDGVSVNEISTDPGRIEWYRKSLEVSVESMEGAALHYVGLMEKIPFLQLRSLSNFVGVRDKSKWLMKEAIQQLNKEVTNCLINFLEL